MSTLLWQQLQTVQAEASPSPKTVASAATIVPETFLTIVTGTVQVATITPPVPGPHMLAFKFTNAAPGALLTTGNIETAYTPIQNRPFLMFYDTSLAVPKYCPMAVS